MELRRILEPAAAKLAAERATDDQLVELHTRLDHLERTIGDVPKWIEADLAFHVCIATASGNKLLRFQMEALRLVFWPVMGRINTRLLTLPKAWRANFERHTALVAAISLKDGQAAFDAMTAHFKPSDDAVHSLFETEKNAV